MDQHFKILNETTLDFLNAISRESEVSKLLVKKS